MSHANAALTPRHRLKVAQLVVDDGYPISEVAARCLKRRLSDIVYRALLDDYVTAKATGPGGHRGTTHQSSAAGSHPHTSTSDKPLPGPVTTKPTTTLPKAS